MVSGWAYQDKRNVSKTSTVWNQYLTSVGHQYRLEKASFMYRRLAVTYGTLCREYDTPLTMDWEDERDVKSADEQKRLKDLYLQLQPAFQTFCTFRGSASTSNS